MQVNQPQGGGAKASTNRATVTLRMLQQHLATIHSSYYAGSDTDLVAEINGREVHLTIDNFQVADDGRIEITVPLEWFSMGMPCRHMGVVND